MSTSAADMNRAFNLRVEDRSPKWRVIDASGQTLGRLATNVADILRGRDKGTFTSHIDCGDYVVIVNAEKVNLTGKKMDQKIYRRHSGWIGGMRETRAKDMLQKKPTFLVEAAVKGMLPKTKLGKAVYKKLKVYAGESHPHHQAS